MKISEIATLLDANILCCKESISGEVQSACGSDMMSDVLAYVKNQAVLLTGLVNPQVIRTAMMMDMRCIVFVRDKKPTNEMIELAKDADIVLLSTHKRMFDACGILYSSGLKPNEV
jgi:predicted transcriptional regulator